jgi:hypothetical protein
VKPADFLAFRDVAAAGRGRFFAGGAGRRRRDIATLRRPYDDVDGPRQSSY